MSGDTGSETPGRPAGRYWLDERRNVDKIWYGLLAICALTVLADLFYHKHVYYPIEDWPGSYGVYGFVACVGLVLAAKLMRRFVIRRERYYDDAR